MEVFMHNGENLDRTVNVVMAILGAFLFVSPWLFGFQQESVAAWNAWIGGAIAAIIALLAANQIYDWEEWLDGIVGFWIAVSPWLLGFTAIRSAMWVHLIVGIAIVVLAATELSRLYRSPRAL
jgi:hypothetical protein